jgi:hypothetical protein
VIFSSRSSSSSLNNVPQTGLLTGLEHLPRVDEALLAGRADVQERGASVTRVRVPFNQPLLLHTVCEATEACSPVRSLAPPGGGQHCDETDEIKLVSGCLVAGSTGLPGD